jgi:hypothetical protein
MQHNIQPQPQFGSDRLRNGVGSGMIRLAVSSEHGYEKGVPGNPGTPTINRSLLLVSDIHLLLWEFGKLVHRPMRAREKIDVAAEPQIA